MPAVGAALVHRLGTQRPSRPGSVPFRRMSSTSTSIAVTAANPEKLSMSARQVDAFAVSGNPNLYSPRCSPMKVHLGP